MHRFEYHKARPEFGIGVVLGDVAQAIDEGIAVLPVVVGKVKHLREHLVERRQVSDPLDGDFDHGHAVRIPTAIDQ